MTPQPGAQPGVRGGGYQQELAGLGAALARVLLTPPPARLPAGEPARLLADRRDVLTSLTGLHRALARDAPGRATTAAEAVDVADLERDPVGTLGVLLRRYPSGPPAARSPTGRVLQTPATPAGQAWRAAAGQALTAAAAAERLDPVWDRDPATAWAAVADLAALVEAFAVADADLAAILPTHPTTHPAPHPTGSSGAGLRTAAACCARLAAGGPLAAVPADLTAPVPPQPAAVTRPAQLAAAQRRTAALLDHTLPAPTLLAQVAVGQARAQLTAARLLHTAAGHVTADPVAGGLLTAAAAAVETRAGHLTEIAERCGPVRALTSGGGWRAGEQTGEILRHLTRLEGTAQPASASAGVVPALLGFAGRGLDVTTAVDRAVRRAVAAGDYLVPNPRTARTAPGWIRARLDDPPPLLAATSRAAAAEPRIAAAVAAAVRHLGGSPATRAGATPAAAELRHARTTRAAARPTRPGPPIPTATVPAAAAPPPPTRRPARQPIRSR